LKSKGEKGNSLALVLSGGGARGAYEAGVMHYLRTQLPEPARTRNFPILCGSSVGAINTCFLASTADDLNYQGNQLLNIWSDLKAENIFSGDLADLSWLLARSAGGIFHNLFRTGFFKEKHGHYSHFSSLFDTKPFRPFLEKIINWKNLRHNVRMGLVQEVAIVATRMRTGQTEIFLQKGAGHIDSDKFVVHAVELGPEHAMASAAIPIVFPNVVIGNGHYLDGSLRFNTPLSAAIHLGANKILAISLASREKSHPAHRCAEGDCPPSLGEYFGKLFNSFFLDRLISDVDQLEKINGIIEAGRKVFGSDFSERINEVLPAGRSIDLVQMLEISPSLSLSTVFSEWYRQDPKASSRLSVLEKFLMRIFDVEPALSMDLLSYLVFEKEYLRQLIDLGFEDGKRNHDRLVSFLE